MIDPSFTENVVCVVPDLYQREENKPLIIMAWTTIYQYSVQTSDLPETRLVKTLSTPEWPRAGQDNKWREGANFMWISYTAPLYFCLQTQAELQAALTQFSLIHFRSKSKKLTLSLNKRIQIGFMWLSHTARKAGLGGFTEYFSGMWQQERTGKRCWEALQKLVLLGQNAWDLSHLNCTAVWTSAVKPSPSSLYNQQKEKMLLEWELLGEKWKAAFRMKLIIGYKELSLTDRKPRCTGLLA